MSAMVNGRYYFPDTNYGRGTASPTTEVDAAPESYDWTSAGICLSSG